MRNVIVKVATCFLFLTTLATPAFPVDPITVTPDGHIWINANGVAVDLVECLVPAGSIQPFAGSTVPGGWALCDGSSVPREGAFARLFSVIGTAFGSSDAASFNLPDLRGRFIRGVDGTAGVDPDKTSRTALKTGGNTGNNIGSAEADAMQGHKHNAPTLIGRDGYSYAGDGPHWSVHQGNNLGPYTPSCSGITTDETYGTARASSETRPVNVYVNFIIKL